MPMSVQERMARIVNDLKELGVAAALQLQPGPTTIIIGMTNDDPHNAMRISVGHDRGVFKVSTSIVTFRQWEVTRTIAEGRCANGMDIDDRKEKP